MKRIIFCLASFVFFINMSASSQGVIPELQAGSGTYSMRDLKSFNRYIKTNIPFDTRTVADFPPFLNYSVILKFRTKNGFLGIFQSYQTTGSRISGKDYSGEYCFDIILNGYSPGIYGELAIPSAKKAEFSFVSTTGIIFTGMKMHEYLVVLEEDVIDDKYNFKSRNFFLEPGFRISYPAGRLSFAFNTGYLIQFGKGSFSSSENKRDKLGNPATGEVIRPGWSGLRAGISVSLNLRAKGTNQQSS